MIPGFIGSHKKVNPLAIERTDEIGNTNETSASFSIPSSFTEIGTAQDKCVIMKILCTGAGALTGITMAGSPMDILFSDNSQTALSTASVHVLGILTSLGGPQTFNFTFASAPGGILIGLWQIPGLIMPSVIDQDYYVGADTSHEFAIRNEYSGCLIGMTLGSGTTNSWSPINTDDANGAGSVAGSTASGNMASSKAAAVTVSGMSTSAVKACSLISLSRYP
jgi:hypothetical protein